ncbi:MAG: helix-turn-helix domain-containing protein [Gordonia sp. (in: high G+C Gram-positive bacteria)]|uniref:helix-turn-helix transcriptional regulator n=1 Tax=Gordonia sp. (in: high G+C Gram-positive bacteria) TaxID=84139 RepID=UPI003BB522AC
MSARSTAATRLLNINQVAEITGFSAKTIRRRIADGTLRAQRIGPRAIRITESDLEAWIGGAA